MSREYALRYFPDFVKKVDEELSKVDKTDPTANVRRPVYNRRWGAEGMIRAGVAWFDKYDKLPVSEEWRFAAKDHPAYMSVLNKFGSWGAFINECKKWIYSRLEGTYHNSQENDEMTNGKSPLAPPRQRHACED